MSDASGVLAGLAEEFTARVRDGDLPAIEDYALRHPALAARIRALFPTLLLLEGLARGGATQVTPGVELAAGQPFGPYTILAEIGRGGMGVVYEALHVALNRRVALKVLPVAHGAGSGHLERFLREARTAAGLHHTNIVPVFDVGQVGGVPYYAMQRIHGRGLEVVLRDLIRPATADPDATAGVLPTAQVPGGTAFYRWVAELGGQAAAALAHAHARGVIHRDIKPSNLLLDEQGVLWVTDFGLARAAGDVTLTQAGQLVGTPRYMSPEQAEATARPVDHRTDIYSLGATLYELLTRRPPVEGATPQEVLHRILQREPVAPRRLDPNIPRDLETIVLKAMARAPQDRYGTAQELADDLRAYLDRRALKARRVGLGVRVVRWAQRNPAIAAMTATLVLVVVTATALATHQARLARAVAEQARHAEMLAHEHAEQAAAAGREVGLREVQRVVDQGLDYAARAELVPALFWFARPLLEKMPLAAEEEAFVRQRVAAFLRYSGLPRPLGVVGATVQHVAALHPDGVTLLRTSPAGVDLVNATTRKVQATYTTPGSVRLAGFLDDGKRIAALCAGRDAASGPLVQVLETTTGKVLGEVALPAQWSWERAHLVPQRAALVLVGPDRKELAVCRLGAARPEWVRRPLLDTAPVEGLSSGPQGELYVVDRDHRVTVWDLATLARKSEQRWERGSGSFTLAPLTEQPRLLTLELGRRGAGTAGLWLPFTETPEALVEGVGQPACLAVRHDGKRLLTGGSRAGTAPHAATLWDVPARRQLFRWPASDSVHEVAFLNRGRWAALKDVQRVCLWEVPEVTPPAKRLLPAGQRAAGGFLLANGGALLLHQNASEENAPYRLDRSDGDKVDHNFPLHDRHNGWFATRNGSFVVTYTNDSSRITVAATATGKVLAKIARPAVGRAALCLSEDGGTLLRLARMEGVVEVIDVATGAVRRTLRLTGQDEEPLAGGFDLVLALDGRRAASLLDGRLQMWDVASGKEVWSRITPEAEGMWFDGTGAALVVSEPNGLRLWDAHTGLPRTATLSGTAQQWVAAWDGESRRVVLVRGSGVTVWDAVAGQALTPLLPHPETVHAARLAPDGHTLTTLDAAGDVRSWDLAPLPLAGDALRGELERATGYRLEASGRVAQIVAGP